MLIFLEQEVLVGRTLAPFFCYLLKVILPSFRVRMCQSLHLFNLSYLLNGYYLMGFQMFSWGNRKKPSYSLTPTHSIINMKRCYLVHTTALLFFLLFSFLSFFDLTHSCSSLDGMQARQLLAAFSSCLVCLAAFMDSSRALP